MPRPFILNNKFDDTAFFAAAFRLYLDVNKDLEDTGAGADEVLPAYIDRLSKYLEKSLCGGGLAQRYLLVETFDALCVDLYGVDTKRPIVLSIQQSLKNSDAFTEGELKTLSTGQIDYTLVTMQAVFAAAMDSICPEAKEVSRLRASINDRLMASPGSPIAAFLVETVEQLNQAIAAYKPYKKTKAKAAFINEYRLAPLLQARDQIVKDIQACKKGRFDIARCSDALTEYLSTTDLSAYGELDTELQRFSTLSEAIAERMAAESSVKVTDDIVDLVVGDIYDARHSRIDEGVFQIPETSRSRSGAFFTGGK